MNEKPKRIVREWLLAGFIVLYLTLGHADRLAHSPWYALTHLPSGHALTACGVNSETGFQHTATEEECAELAAILHQLPRDAFIWNKHHAGITPSFGVTVNYRSLSLRFNEVGPDSVELNLPDGEQWWINDPALARWCGKVCGVTQERIA